MPRTRGGQAVVGRGGGRGGGRGEDRGIGRGRGRGRARGVNPEGGTTEGLEVVRGAQRRVQRRPRARGGRGRVHEVERSSLYVGDIISTDPDATTVHVGNPLEKPMHQKVPRRWNPNLPAPSLAESIATSAHLQTPGPSASASQVPSPAEFLDIPSRPDTPQGFASPRPSSSLSTVTSAFLRTPRPSASASQVPSPAEFLDIPSRPDTPQGFASPRPSSSLSTATSAFLRTPRPSASASQVPSPAEFIELSNTTDTPKGVSVKPSSSVSGSRKRKLVYNVDDPELADLVNYGSDPDDDEDVDEDDDVFGFMQCPRSERIYMDSLFDFDAPMDLPTEPSSSAEATGSPPSTPAPSTSAPSTSAPSTSTPSTSETQGPHSLAEFVWESLPQPAIPPQQRREKFSGSVGPVSHFASPYEAFVSIWDRSIMEYIAAETNRYAKQSLEAALSKGSLGPHSRLRLYKETDADELYVFFGLIIATGIVFKSDLTEYWTVKGEVFDTPNFSRYMSYTRFIALAQMLHFVDNEVDISHLSKSDAKIAKIAPIVKHLNEKFQAFYQLGQCIALDESLTQWKGWLSINQFIKNKAASKGVKTYEVCDSNSGYLWRFKMHAGRNEDDVNELGYITPLVLELLKGLEYKGHTVFMDNYYNSPLLSRILKAQGFDCVGTLRLNRQNVPSNLKEVIKRPLAVGSVHGVTSGDVDVLVWKDRNVVSLTSTYHGAASASRDGKAKPTLVHDYNVRMGGVDKKDQMLSAYPIERKRTTVWYKKFFRRLLNVSILNGYILHRESPAPEHPHPHVTTHRQFRKTLVKEILDKHAQQRAVTIEPLEPPHSVKVKFSTEILRHFPKEFPFNEKLKQRKRGACSVCHKRTQFLCLVCNVALCIENCFTQYHS